MNNDFNYYDEFPNEDPFITAEHSIEATDNLRDAVKEYLATHSVADILQLISSCLV